MIRIAFTDFGKNFNMTNNFIINTLRKYYDVVLDLENPEYLFFATQGYHHLEYNNCVKIFWCGEAVTPNFRECDFAVGYDYIDYGERYKRLDRTVFRQPFLNEDKLINRKFCNYIYSNTSTGSGAYLREKFCRILMNYKKVECPGLSLHNISNVISGRHDKDWIKSKIKYISGFKFTISFENAKKSGYVTEKLMHPLMANSVPIYWGDPEIYREFNDKAFINVDNFENFNDVVKYIQYLDENNNEYLDILYQNPMNERYIFEENKIEKFITNIIKNYKIPIDKTPHIFHDSEKRKINDLSKELAQLYIEKNNFELAKKYCNDVILLDRSLEWPYEKLNDIYKISGDRELFNKLSEFSFNFIRNNEMNVRVFKTANFVVNLLIMYKSFEEAEKLCKFLINRDIYLSWPYFSLSRIHYFNKMYNDSLKECNKAIDLSNNDPNIIHFKSCIYEKMKNFDEAEKFAKIALKTLKKPHIFYTLSRINKFRNNLDMAIYYCKEAIKFTKKDSPLLNELNKYLDMLSLTN